MGQYGVGGVSLHWIGLGRAVMVLEDLEVAARASGHSVSLCLADDAVVVSPEGPAGDEGKGSGGRGASCPMGMLDAMRHQFGTPISDEKLKGEYT